MSDHEPLPAVRGVEISPFRNDNGETYFALQDHLRLTPGPLAVSAAGFFIIAQLDGQRTRADVQEAFSGQFGQTLPVEQIDKVVAALDQALLLDNARFEQAYAARRAEYVRGAARDGRARWPDAGALRGEVQRLLAADGAPPSKDAVKGVIAPHLDYARGGPCYSSAYRALAQAVPAERYVILGTNHFGRSLSVVATRKDFQTPLGLARTDTALIDRIEERLGAPICEEEPDHELEHSIELQVHILQVLQPDDPFEIVPVLCPDPCGPSGTAPLDGRGPDLGAFADALRAELEANAKKTVLIAGADLSHVGQHFGETQASTPAFLEQVTDSDRRLLSILERRGEQAFVEAVRQEENRTRICSVGCIYTLMRALPGSACRLLKYHQAVSYETETHVTCAAAVIE